MSLSAGRDGHANLYDHGGEVNIKADEKDGELAKAIRAARADKDFVAVVRVAEKALNLALFKARTFGIESNAEVTIHKDRFVQVRVGMQRSL